MIKTYAWNCKLSCVYPSKAYGYVISCFYKLLQTVSFSQVFMSGDNFKLANPNGLYVVGTRECSIVFKRKFYIHVKTITTLVHIRGNNFLVSYTLNCIFSFKENLTVTAWQWLWLLKENNEKQTNKSVSKLNSYLFPLIFSELPLIRQLP